MTAHSTVLAQRIPWTEEPGRPQGCSCRTQLSDKTINRYCTWASLWLSGKESACQCRRHKRREFDSSVGKIPWGRKCNPLQNSCLENSMDRGTWQAAIHGIMKSQAQLSMHAHTVSCVEQLCVSAFLVVVLTLVEAYQCQ